MHSTFANYSSHIAPRSMSDAVALKQEIIAASKRRVVACVTRQLDVVETLTAVFVCSFASPSDAIEMIFDRHSAKELSKSIEEVSLNTHEITTVLSSIVHKKTSSKAEALLAQTTHAIAKIESCLVATLREGEAMKQWKLPLVRVAVLSAFLCGDFDAGRISSVLGCFVDADRRRGDDFHAEGLELSPTVLVSVVEAVVDAFL